MDNGVPTIKALTPGHTLYKYAARNTVALTKAAREICGVNTPTSKEDETRFITCFVGASLNFLRPQEVKECIEAATKALLKIREQREANQRAAMEAAVPHKDGAN